MLHSRLADRTIGGETIFLLIHWSSDTLNTVQEIARQSLQEIREHTRSMISDPRALPYYVLAAGAIVTSIGLYFAGRKHESLFFCALASNHSHDGDPECREVSPSVLQ
jgi:hypothetical protein